MNQTLPTGPAYRIETARLVIRCWEPKDAPLLNAALRASWEHLGPWMPWARGELPPVANTTSLLRRWRGEFDLDQDYVYSIFNRDETQALGSSGLHTRRGRDIREIGYWVHVDHIGKGIATEMASALTKVAFEVDKVRLAEIRVEVGNVRSAAVPRKLGYTHEATLRQRIDNGDRGHADVEIWTIVADEYTDSRSSEADVHAYNAMGERLL
ncbi:MAG: GNAT family N-acetyltransferase [Anaerolineae bacterium]|nr:GNAT family N-acetyltransferase [Anaerolineae bacterium]